MATYGPEEFQTKTGKKIIFRHCDVGDVASFLEFQPKIAAETTHTLQVVGSLPDPEKVRANWEAWKPDPVALRLGAFHENRLVAQLPFNLRQQPPHPWRMHVGYFGMMVLQEFWGEGLGRRMLEIMEVHAKKVGITKIEAYVRTKNERGLRLYTRMGYEIEGTHRGGSLIDGELCDEHAIAKFLDKDDSWQPPRLETERLLLRPLEIADAPAIFEYAKEPNVSRYTLWEPHRSVKDSESYILDYALPKYRQQVPEPWGIALKSEPGKIIGTVGCFWVSRAAKSMELAYALAEPHWGKGLVAEACRPVVDYVFKEYGLVRVQARCKAENAASARVMEKLGMQQEGTLRKALEHRGRWWDMRVYAVVR